MAKLSEIEMRRRFIRLVETMTPEGRKLTKRLLTSGDATSLPGSRILNESHVPRSFHRATTRNLGR
jgi:hypothetical protein